MRISRNVREMEIMAEVSIQQAFDLAQRSYNAGQSPQAETLCREVLAKQPNHAETLNLLAVVIFYKGDVLGALELIDRAILNAPEAAHFLCNRAMVLSVLGRMPEAMVAARKAVLIRPQFAAAHNYLGHMLYANGDFTEAIGAFRRALSLQPNFAAALNNLGNALKDSGRIVESIDCYERAIAFDPHSASIHSNLVLAGVYHPDRDESWMKKNLRHWDEQHAKPLAGEIREFSNDRNQSRRLRIGYVSPDFREHSVSYFLENLLAHHQSSDFEIFCYGDLVNIDEFTRRIQSAAHHWRRTSGFSDAQIAEMIRQDQIDILVDLAGHTAGNRLLVFARRPAPVQATYLGYPDTTGLTAMDYRLTDGVVDPSGETEHWQSEKLVRLPNSFACYKPPEAAPEIGELPAKTRGFITFGSFNVLAKISDKTLLVWAGILKQIPQSRLMIVAKGLSDETVATGIVRTVAGHGIGSERLILHGQQSMRDYLALHQEVDVVLDTFPVNGHTVTCHALWMGVPVVCLSGKTCCQRLGASVLRTLGLDELIASNAEEYARIAVNLANDLAELSSFRLSLRGKMVQSALMDAKGFARDVESAYRKMWREWSVSQQ